MLKKLIITFMLFIFSLVLNGQSLEIKPYGVSPRDAEIDTTDIFDLAYNGLKNVGVETKIYLAGMAVDTAFTNPQWNIVSKPAGSSTSIVANADLDENTKIIAIIPDVAGTYQIEFSDGGELLASITINAGKYIGMPSSGLTCGTCHSDVQAKWESTGHSTALVRGLNGQKGTFFGSNCVSCHSTGNNPDANNDGFDDFDFVFPDSLFVGQYDSSKAFYPEAMNRANVQCESCHGPGSEHNGNTADSKIVSTLDSKNCAVCHDSGTHHVYPAQFDVSRHANPTTLSRGASASCARCHSGSGFVAYVKNGMQNPAEIPAPEKISCAVCHDPHDNSNSHQLRLTEATLANGYVVPLGNAGRLCINCHQSRRNAEDYTDNYLSNLSSHYGPHYGTQGDMLVGQNAVTWGQNLPSSPHLQAIENACAGCHMAEGQIDTEGNVILSGSHSFSMRTPDGIANVGACEDCHGNIGEDFNEKKFFKDGNADHDGDGVEEGIQEEVHGLLEQILELIPHDENGHPTVTDSTITLLQAQAAYNYLFVEEDRSMGIHNPEFVIGLLKLTLSQLGTVGVEKTELLPQTYTLEQNYPNPFNPTTVINFSLPKAGDVRLTIYDGLGREVNKLVDQKMEAGNYNADWNATNFAAGIYFYSLSVNDFVSTKKMVLLK